MEILLAFAPFFAYVAVELVANITAGLVAATLTSAALLLRSALNPNRTIKVLEVGTFILFAGLVVYAWFAKPTWPIPQIRLRVDGGLLLIVLASMAIGKPFTLQYAREKVAPELWTSPTFIRTNYIITAVWAAAFAIIVLADLALIKMPDMPVRRAIIIAILALYAAAKFTAWYPTRKRATTNPTN
jgi:hypothetical protein